eukprot:m.160238 g.160238  ORF g.160238 m.160238 type:complete len:407 (-) comp14347_c0_seq4:53-1273(-)
MSANSSFASVSDVAGVKCIVQAQTLPALSPDDIVVLCAEDQWTTIQLKAESPLTFETTIVIGLEDRNVTDAIQAKLAALPKPLVDFKLDDVQAAVSPAQVEHGVLGSIKVAWCVATEFVFKMKCKGSDLTGPGQKGIPFCISAVTSCVEQPGLQWHGVSSPVKVYGGKGQIERHIKQKMKRIVESQQPLVFPQQAELELFRQDHHEEVAHHLQLPSHDTSAASSPASEQPTQSQLVHSPTSVTAAVHPGLDMVHINEQAPLEMPSAKVSSPQKQDSFSTFVESMLDAAPGISSAAIFEYSMSPSQVADWLQANGFIDIMHHFSSYTGLDLSRLSEHQISSFGISLPEATRLYNRIHSGDLVRLVDDFSFDIPQQHDSFSSLSLGVNSLSLDLEDGEPLPSDELPPF